MSFLTIIVSAAGGCGRQLGDHRLGDGRPERGPRAAPTTTGVIPPPLMVISVPQAPLFTAYGTSPAGQC